MPPTRKSRIYTRKRGAAARYYADFREYADVGGGLEALIPPNGRSATTDPDIAESLVADRLEELRGKRQNRVILGITKETDLASYVADHLIKKKQSGRVTDGWVADSQRYLDHAIEFFETTGPRDLLSIGVEDVQAWADALSQTPSNRRDPNDPEGERRLPLSPGTVRHFLNALSNLYVRAQSEGYAPPGWNPVQAMIDKPVARADEAEWLEVHEAALFLEAARLYKPKREDVAIPPRRLYALIATFLLTGGRETEVYGLEMDDVSFDRRKITFRTNAWRRLKTRNSRRTVPLWPQLEEILREYVFGAGAPPGRLLFPGVVRTKRRQGQPSKEQMITDIRKALDGIAETCGWRGGDIRTKAFRHTYCAARLQTLDHGAPVSLYTVARDMGHGGDALVRRVYGHLGDVRHRSEAIEYRIEQHAGRDGIPERLDALRATKN